MKFQNVSNNTHVTRPIEGVYECRKYFVKPRRWRQKPGHVEEPGEIPGYAGSSGILLPTLQTNSISHSFLHEFPSIWRECRVQRVRYCR